MGIRHKLLRELRIRVAAYDFRVKMGDRVVSAAPVVEAARKVAQNYRQTREERNAAHAEYNRQLRAEWEAKGLCRKCGKRPPRPERTRCAECAARDALSSKRQYQSMKKKLKDVHNEIKRGEE